MFGLNAKLLCFVTFLGFGFFGCIHPKVGLRKSRLVDPMMDPALANNFGETLSSTVQSQFEKAVVSGGGVGGGSCPTCK